MTKRKIFDIIFLENETRIKDEELKFYTCISSSHKNVLTRISQITKGVEDLNKQWNPDQVIMEQIIPDNLNDVKWSRNQATFKALFYLQAAIALMFHYYNKEVEFIGASSWRKDCGIRQGGLTRDALKAEDIKFVKEHYNLSVNDDIADAICIGHAKVHHKPEPQPFNWE